MTRISCRLSRGTVHILALVAFATTAPGAAASAQRRGSARPSRDTTLLLAASLGARTLYVIRGGDTTAAYPIGIGDSASPTPTGRFRIARIDWNPKWIPPEESWAAPKDPQPPGARANPMRLVKIFFREPAYYIHGSNEPRSIGYALSHGCLRMEPMDAYRLGRLLMTHAGVRRTPAWYSRVLRVRTVTRTVRLPRPVVMEIAD